MGCVHVLRKREDIAHKTIKTKAHMQKWYVYETSSVLGVECSWWRIIENWNVHTNNLWILLKYVLWFSRFGVRWPELLVLPVMLWVARVSNQIIPQCRCNRRCSPDTLAEPKGAEDSGRNQVGPYCSVVGRRLVLGNGWLDGSIWGSVGVHSHSSGVNWGSEQGGNWGREEK